MKKIITLVAILIAVFLVSCSDSIESVAKKRVRPLTEKYVKDPTSLIIDNKEVMVSNDSLCVIHYLAKVENIFGGYTTTKMEYVCAYIPDRNGRIYFAEYTQSIDGLRFNYTILKHHLSIFAQDNMKPIADEEDYYKNAIDLLQKYGDKVPE